MTDRMPASRLEVEDALWALVDAAAARSRALWGTGEPPGGVSYREASEIERARFVAAMRLVEDYASGRVERALREQIGTESFLALRAEGLV